MVIREVADQLGKSVEEIEALVAADDKLKSYMGSHIKGDGEFADRTVTATGAMAIKEGFAKMPVNEKSATAPTPPRKSSKKTNTGTNPSSEGVKKRHRRTKAEIEADKSAKGTPKDIKIKIEKKSPFESALNIPIIECRKILAKEIPLETLAMMDDAKAKETINEKFRGILIDDTLHLYAKEIL